MVKVADSRIIQWARLIEKSENRVRRLVNKIEASGHPNAAELTEALSRAGYPNPATAPHIVRAHLEYPARWVPVGTDVVRNGAKE